MTIFTFNDGGEIKLSPGQVQQIAESYNRVFKVGLKYQRDAYKAQRDQAVEALIKLRIAVLNYLSVENDIGKLSDAYNAAHATPPDMSDELE